MRRFSAATVVTSSAAAALAASLGMHRVLRRDGAADAPAPATRASLPVTPATIPRLLRVEFSAADGSRRYARLDAAALDAEARRQLDALEAERPRLAERARALVHEETGGALARLEQPAASRVAAFAEWYFAYHTSYQLLRVASAAAARAALGGGDARAAAEAAVIGAVNEKYEALCLRPALLEPALRRAFVHAAERTHAEFLRRLDDVHAGGVQLLREHTEHAAPPGAERAALRVDWAHARALAGGLSAAFDRPDLGNTAALLGGGLAAGKLLAPKAAAAAASKAGGGAGTALLSKLSSPIVAKALGGTATATAATAGALAGPAGALVGAAAGVGVDYALNAALKLQQHDSFVSDVCDAIAAAREEWEEVMTAELVRAVDVWIEDAKQLSAAHAPREESTEPPRAVPILQDSEADGSNAVRDLPVDSSES
ncbi:hypothetical protein AB1Y20_006540 [Prymnesium parvum]|uniref:Uncharacterized protein n=1 Tax=Prymnesium parvum TaxID=97485 RepID=A0AB34IZ39_PRYPA